MKVLVSPVVLVLVAALLSACGGASNPGFFRPLDGGSCDGGPCPCTLDAQCSGATPRCDKNAGRCVPCLPQGDNCPLGQRCVSVGGSFMCSSTCFSDADCPRSDAGASTTCCAGACLDTAADSSNCGGCGKACPVPPNASAACTASVCGIGACSAGFLDCDKSPANGCEIDSSKDAKSCGACGTVCASGANQSAACMAGKCTTTCAMGFEDCNMNAADGCEASTETSVAHCGGCNKGCGPLANAGPACVAGACQIASCDNGFGDCNKMANDGCEVSLQQDVAHCGACGNACAPQNAAPACNAGRCAVASCNMGFADCDAVANNGCEVAIANDANNCGACGRRCAGANSVQGCNAMVCTIQSCAQGFADCDGMAASGCEVSSATDVNNCGGCGMRCPMVANGSPVCSGAACAVGQCNFGFADCNKQLNDGCETSILTVANCGACGNACPVPANAAAVCAGGVCGLGACNPQFGNCDNNPGNGCERSLGADVANCGACGKVCAAANGTPSCVNGACAVAACNAGFANCDNNPANGCEVNTNTDANNCGVCGKVCPVNQTCSAGVCLAALRPNVMLCGTSSKALSSFFPMGTNFAVVNSCAPDVNTQALFITRNWNSGIGAVALQSYLNAGGVVLTEFNISHLVWNAAFGTAAVLGTRFGSCTDNLPSVAQFNPADAFWKANVFQVQALNASGCGHAVQAFPGIVTLAGWDGVNAAVGYRDLGAGRLWATDFDWQDANGSQAYTNQLMGYMMTHRR